MLLSVFLKFIILKGLFDFILRQFGLEMVLVDVISLNLLLKNGFDFPAIKLSYLQIPEKTVKSY
jgi:hypothetical protein